MTLRACTTLNTDIATQKPCRWMALETRCDLRIRLSLHFMPSVPLLAQYMHAVHTYFLHFPIPPQQKSVYLLKGKIQRSSMIGVSDRACRMRLLLIQSFPPHFCGYICTYNQPGIAVPYLRHVNVSDYISICFRLQLLMLRLYCIQTFTKPLRYSVISADRTK